MPPPTNRAGSCNCAEFTAAFVAGLAGDELPRGLVEDEQSGRSVVALGSSAGWLAACALGLASFVPLQIVKRLMPGEKKPKHKASVLVGISARLRPGTAR